jgi:hypothetical protein
VSVSVSNIYKDTAQALALVLFERTALMLIVNSPKEVNKLVREGNYAFGRLDFKGSNRLNQSDLGCLRRALRFALLG